MKINKLTIVIVFIVIIVILGIFSLLSRRKNSSTVSFSPTPTPFEIPGGKNGTSFGNIQYDQKQTSKIINEIENRPSISPSDSNIKTNIISSLGNVSGTVNSIDSEYRIDYLKSQDLFQVEVETIDIQKAKADAVAWFMSQGMTQEGICKLPLNFYLNFDIKQQLRSTGTTVNFNPLPDGC